MPFIEGLGENCLKSGYVLSYEMTYLFVQNWYESLRYYEIVWDIHIEDYFSIYYIFGKKSKGHNFAESQSVKNYGTNRKVLS